MGPTRKLGKNLGRKFMSCSHKNVVIVKSFVKKQAGSWLAAQELATNQQVDQTLDTEYNS